MPAIDIREGRCVRLLQGRDDARTGYGDPVYAARAWIDKGAEWLHVVDLDGAFGRGHDARYALFERIASLGVPVQMGGGVRTLEDIERRFQLGSSRVVLGTVALIDPDMAREACLLFPDRIAIGIDARCGKTVIRGWTEETNTDALDLARSMRELGARWIVYTDVARDGMLEGPNIHETERMARESGANVIGSGGVSSIEDVIDLREAGCAGAIIGKALYERRMMLEDAMAAASGG